VNNLLILICFLMGLSGFVFIGAMSLDQLVYANRYEDNWITKNEREINKIIKVMGWTLAFIWLICFVLMIFTCASWIIGRWF
jgi:hypothetical protein